MGAFTGQLRSNEIFSALYNMIISQRVFADNIKGTYSELVDRARVDGGLYGDTKLYYSTDALGSHEWGADDEASNLLAVHRPKDPKVQAIHLDIFRQIDLTIDYYLSKRAWGTEGSFMSFTSVMLGWLRDTKRIYDSTLYNAFLGTAESSIGKQNQDVKIASAIEGLDKEQAARVEAQVTAQHIADLIVEMKDVSRDFNDYGQIRSYSEDEIEIIWNAKHANKIRYVDLPTIFHSENLIKKFAINVLPARYFGHRLDSVLAEASVYNQSSNPTGMFTKSGNDYTIVNTGGTASKVRSLIETEYTVQGVVTHVFPGDSIPIGAVLTVTSNTVPFAYIENEDIMAKVLTELPPFMSAFEVGTSFYNPKALLENHYLTWGHNTLEYLKAKPMITLNKD